MDHTSNTTLNKFHHENCPMPTYSAAVHLTFDLLS